MSLVVSRQREAEIPRALMMPPHSVWPANSDVANAQRAHASAAIEAQKFSEIPLARILHPHIVFLAGSDVVNPQRVQACSVIEARISHASGVSCPQQPNTPPQFHQEKIKKTPS